MEWLLERSSRITLSAVCGLVEQPPEGLDEPVQLFACLPAGAVQINEACLVLEPPLNG